MIVDQKLYQEILVENKNDIVHIGFGYRCQKTMTVLDQDTLTELKHIIEYVEKKQKDLKGVLFYSLKKRCFLAGVDIKLISKMKTIPELIVGSEMGQTLFNRLEDLKIPTIAAVHGVCLGGGLELCLSCDHIIASNDPSTNFGLPEVKLGLLPGFGGTYRLSKRVGLRSALGIILTGKTFNAKRSKQKFLIDQIYPKGKLLDKAVELLGSFQEKTSLKRSLMRYTENTFFMRKIIYQKAREQIMTKTKGFYHAPLKILEVMESGMNKQRSAYLTMEAEAFAELAIGEQSQNLQHLFFMIEGSKKYPGKVHAPTSDSMKRGAVVGAGTMGGGLTYLMADLQMSPKMKDLNKEALELGLQKSSSYFKSSIKNRKITYDQFQKRQRSICPQINYSGFSKMDIVIEAVVEQIKVKKSVLREIEKNVKPQALIVSNTSSISIEEMAASLEHPHRFGGLHFFNPVNKMPLVEIITHSRMDKKTIQDLYNWVLKIKKTPVIVKDGPGFLVNRILMCYLNEAGFLLEEGVPLKDIEQACLNFGMPVGPAHLIDQIGIDVAVKVADILHRGLGQRVKPSRVLLDLFEKQCFGLKNKKGFYLYDKQGKVLKENCELDLPKRKILSDTQIQLRLFLPMINESAYILNEKIIGSAEKIDLALIFGIGFPAFRGGLLKYADNEGLKNIYKTLKHFNNTVSIDRYNPAPFFSDMLKNDKKFYDL